MLMSNICTLIRDNYIKWTILHAHKPLGTIYCNKLLAIYFQFACCCRAILTQSHKIVLKLYACAGTVTFPLIFWFSLAQAESYASIFMLPFLLCFKVILTLTLCYYKHDNVVLEDGNTIHTVSVTTDTFFL